MIFKIVDDKVRQKTSRGESVEENKDDETSQVNARPIKWMSGLGPPTNILIHTVWQYNN